MEAKFFAEIGKNMDIKTLKDFEKEVRTKINHEFESLRKKNEDLSRVLMAGECEIWGKIRHEDYSWLKIKSDKKKLFRLIDIYSKFDDIVDSVKDLSTNVLGPVARSLVSANRWLRGIKMYRFPWYLTLVSANHASSNPGQGVKRLKDAPVEESE